MNTSIHEIMTEHASYSWNCLKCGLPNFNTTLFDDLSTSNCSLNSFSVLEASLLLPKSSAPIKKKTATKQQKNFKIVNLNFQSVVNKVPEFHCMIETEKPDIVIGTESWLSPDIFNGEIFLPGYTVYRADRKSRGLYYGSRRHCLYRATTIQNKL